MVRTAIQEHIEELRARIHDVELWMRQHAKKHERLNEQYKLLTSIIGIGDVAAFTYLGELGYSDRFNKTRQVESFCGLTPKKTQSGTSVHRRDRLSKIGNIQLRTALFMPAMCSMQHNPVIRNFVNRLREAGKPPKVIICAVIRKLLRIMFAVIKSGKPFDLCYRPRSNTDMISTTNSLTVLGGDSTAMVSKDSQACAFHVRPIKNMSKKKLDTASHYLCQ
jgi:transposase